MKRKFLAFLVLPFCSFLNFVVAEGPDDFIVYQDQQDRQRQEQAVENQRLEEKRVDQQLEDKRLEKARVQQRIDDERRVRRFLD